MRKPWVVIVMILFAVAAAGCLGYNDGAPAQSTTSTFTESTPTPHTTITSSAKMQSINIPGMNPSDASAIANEVTFTKYSSLWSGQTISPVEAIVRYIDNGKTVLYTTWQMHGDLKYYVSYTSYGSSTTYQYMPPRVEVYDIYGHSGNVWTVYLYIDGVKDLRYFGYEIPLTLNGYTISGRAVPAKDLQIDVTLYYPFVK